MSVAGPFLMRITIHKQLAKMVFDQTARLVDVRVVPLWSAPAFGKDVHDITRAPTGVRECERVVSCRERSRREVDGTRIWPTSRMTGDISVSSTTITGQGASIASRATSGLTLPSCACTPTVGWSRGVNAVTN